jgi:hypothetical protein
MTDDRTFVLEFIAVQLVVITAMLHLALGIFNWQRWFEAGFLVPEDTRWPLFIVSGIVLLVGTAIAHTRENRRPFYAAGIVLMAGYIVGYFSWHLLGHRQYILFGPGVGAEQLSVQWFLDHLLAGPVEFGAIVVEVAAIVVLAVLLVSERE